ncbi:MAG: hypothetical protein ACK4ZE_12480, partial [Sphingorhabdus sp.]
PPDRIISSADTNIVQRHPFKRRYSAKKPTKSASSSTMQMLDGNGSINQALSKISIWQSFANFKHKLKRFAGQPSKPGKRPWHK